MSNPTKPLPSLRVGKNALHINREGRKTLEDVEFFVPRRLFSSLFLRRVLQFSSLAVEECEEQHYFFFFYFFCAKNVRNPYYNHYYEKTKATTTPTAPESKHPAANLGGFIAVRNDQRFVRYDRDVVRDDRDYLVREVSE